MYKAISRPSLNPKPLNPKTLPFRVGSSEVKAAGQRLASLDCQDKANSILSAADQHQQQHEDKDEADPSSLADLSGT